VNNWVVISIVHCKAAGNRNQTCILSLEQLSGISSEPLKKGIMAMNMQKHDDICKRRAKQIKSDYPDIVYTKRLDIAAQEQGFKHYTALRNLYKLIGADKSPSQLEIVLAGGNPEDSPYALIHSSVTVQWGSGRPLSTSTQVSAD